MRGLGMVLLTGAAAVVLWKIFAAMFVGLLGLLFKALIIFAVVYFVLQIFQKNKSKSE